MLNVIKWKHIHSSAAIITALHNELNQKTKAGTVNNADDALLNYGASIWPDVLGISVDLAACKFLQSMIPNICTWESQSHHIVAASGWCEWL